MKTSLPQIGILGGGQLGKMLCEAAIPWHLPLHVLEQNESFPAVTYAPYYRRGDFKNYDDVLAFGRELDVITIEIENVNTRALKELEASGVDVFPQPHIIELIQDKGLQKEFYQRHQIPTAPFVNLSWDQLNDQLNNGKLKFPFVQKVRTGGYDGKGVSIIKGREDLIVNVSSVIETLAPIDKEISIIVARDRRGKIASYEPVEMVFDPRANLVEYLISPAAISKDLKARANDIAQSVIAQLEMVGILAVEMFVLESGQIWVNEVAPRPHNSGHHTIKSVHCSQYEQLLRILAGFPMIYPQAASPAMMINILGPEGKSGVPQYHGLEDILSIDGIYLYLYGKKESRPYRKLGHWTLTGESRQSLFEKKQWINDHFNISIE